jgi:hypothetical protein
MNNSSKKIQRFDQVKLLTIKNVAYLSAPPGSQIIPQGIWSVVAAVEDNELLLAKDNAIIRIPASDVLVISEYDIDLLNSILGNLSNGQAEEKHANS